MGLPGEIRHLIMLHVFNEKDLIISLDPKHSLEEDDFGFRSSFHTAPLLVCKQMRLDALDALMQGIELQADSLCDVQYLEVLPPAIRQCIRWFDSKYDLDCCANPEPPKDVWLGPSWFRQLPNVESIFLIVCGDTIEIPSVTSEAELRSKVESQKAVDDIDMYLRDPCDVHREMLGKLERDVVVHLHMGLCSNWKLWQTSGLDPDYLSVSQQSQPAIAPDDEIGPRNSPQQAE